MFSYFKMIHPNLYERYLTLERNIKAKSNSFYDSYLDLVENFIKNLLREIGYESKSNETCGAILRKTEVRAFLTEAIGFDEHTYDKLGDYTLKVNAHKHKLEKTVQLETVISYLSILHAALSAYARYKGAPVKAFNKDYFSTIFGEFERENEKLKKELNALLSGLSHQKLDEHDFENLTLEEQNAILYREILRIKEQHEKDTQAILEELKQLKQGPKTKTPRQSTESTVQSFLRRAVKTYRYCGTPADFEVTQRKTLILNVILLLLGVISTALTTSSVGIYTTFSLFENIWLFFVAANLLSVSRAALKCNGNALSDICPFGTFYNANGTLQKELFLKFRYRLFRTIACIAAALNILYIWLTIGGAAAVFATLFEIAFFVLTIVTLNKVDMFFSFYCVVYYTGKNDLGQEITIVYHELLEEFYPLDVFQNKFHLD